MTRRTLAACTTAALALAAFAALPTLARAQALWMDRNRPSTIQLEVLKPEFDGDDNLTFLTTTWFLSGRAQFSPTVHGVLELPFATSGVQGDPLSSSDETGGVFGNPYVGVELGSAAAPVLVEFGVRAPLAGSKFVTSVTALYSDVERWEAWIDEAGAIRLGLRVRSHPDESGLSVEGRFAPALWFTTDDLFADTEMWATYGVAGRLDRPAVRGGMGVTGRVFFDALDEGIGEATLHQLDVAADFGRGRLRPGASVRVPLDDGLTDALDVVWGVSLSYAP